MPVILIGTLDTKGVEYAFVRDQFRAAGLDTVVIDVGVLGEPFFVPDVSREEVFAAAGFKLDALRRENDRGKAVAAAAEGAAKLMRQRAAEIDGILALGGSAGTTIGTAAMRTLPFGIPKLMVSTLASGQVRPYVGVRDIMMMHSVVDISGLNRISRAVLTNAANAMIGMVRATRSRTNDRPSDSAEKVSLAATMFGVTTPCVDAARGILQASGYEILVFHATGSGGMTMESFVKDGIVRGVLDITTTELADELVGGVLSAGPDRLTAAGETGVPQVISVGALDMVNFGPPHTVPEKFRGRRFHQHNPSVTLMRTTPEENDKLGKEIAHKASAAKGPTVVLIPLRGVSAIDAESQPFWWPEADAALFQSLRQWMSPHVELVELDLHINDAQFAHAAATHLLRLMRGRRGLEGELSR